jgi:radical SAM superfamily enzyme YgiQ (UPF0313 family)
VTWRQIEQAKHLLEEEQGTVFKDWGGRLPIALVFPNTYHVGMSSLAVHTLYGLWNSRDDIVCERVFTDWMPPSSMETGAPLDYFPVVAFSLSHEMDYFNVVTLLRMAGIPPRSAERDETHPLLIAGGPAVSANPEPLAAILDAFVIGEVEPLLPSLTECLHLIPESREGTLEALSRLPGLYVPHLSSNSRGNQRCVVRQWLRDLDSHPVHSVILTSHTEFSNMGLIEIARGCGRACRFCLAGYTYRPPRHRSVASILEQAQELLGRTHRLGLVSAAVTDHPEIDQLAHELRRLGALISVSSMRVDPVSEPLVRALAESGTQTLTLAPEAGSDRLRQVINKTQTEADVLHAVDLAGQYGLKQLKLYFILGLPTEEQADVHALVELALSCARRFPRRVTVNLTPFVPKAHTPFQRLAQFPAVEVGRRINYVRKHLRRQGIGVKAESPAWAEIQGTLARGDRSVSEALLSVGSISPASWRQALARSGLSVQYFLRTRSSTEALPWGFLETGVKPSFLDGELRRCESARTSPPCPPEGCAACGVCSLCG